jgi:AbrB family transcriptional regulator (stage V sporulation protein T)
MHIREGDPLEIYTDRDGEVIFKKYSPIGEIGDFAAGYCEVLAKAIGRGVLITDRDEVVAASGVSKKDFLEKRLSKPMEQAMEGRTAFRREGEGLELLEGNGTVCADIVAPILANGDVIGSVTLVGGNGEAVAGEADLRLLQVSAGLLGRHMES